MGDLRLGNAALSASLATATLDPSNDIVEDEGPDDASGQRDSMSLSSLSGISAPMDSATALRADARLRTLLDEHFDFIWRSLRRLGVPMTDVDDCTQQVFWVAARKVDLIAVGSERAFLFSTALRVASDSRRSRMRRREVQDDETIHPSDPGPRPDELADRVRARALLDTVLASMPIDLRAVFVLFE